MKLKLANSFEKVKKASHQVKAISDKGYCLNQVLDDMTAENCVSKIHTLWAGKYYEYYKCIDSTNNRGKELGNQFGMNGAFVVADSQESGKGRRGRTWESSYGTSLLMSLVLQPNIEPQNASMLTLVNALAVRMAIEKTTKLKTNIKWPNDIVINGRKLAGILTEMSTENNKIRYIVIGTGINVNNQQFPREISDIATSLYKEIGQCVSRQTLMIQYLECFEHYYDVFMKTEDLSNLQNEYESYLVSMGKEVRILDGTNDNDIGVCQGITTQGDFLVKMSDGTIKNVLSGEVSVRGVYGYV